MQHRCDAQSAGNSHHLNKAGKTGGSGDCQDAKKETLDAKILVAYASKSGTTVEVAQAIGKALAGKGAAVEVKPVKTVTSIDGYCAVILGSGVRMGQWLPEAMQFLRKNQAKLNQLPTAIFSVHLLNTGDDEGSRAKREAYTAPARPIVTPRAETFFAGRLDFSKLTLFESLMSKAMKAQEQDLRLDPDPLVGGRSVSFANPGVNAIGLSTVPGLQRTRRRHIGTPPARAGRQKKTTPKVDVAATLLGLKNTVIPAHSQRAAPFSNQPRNRQRSGRDAGGSIASLSTRYASKPASQA